MSNAKMGPSSPNQDTNRTPESDLTQASSFTTEEQDRIDAEVQRILEDQRLSEEERKQRVIAERRKRRWKTWQKKKAAAMIHLEGVHPKLVAAKFRTSVQTVQKWAEKHERDVKHEALVEKIESLESRIEELVSENGRLEAGNEKLRAQVEVLTGRKAS